MVVRVRARMTGRRRWDERRMMGLGIREPWEGEGFGKSYGSVQRGCGMVFSRTK